MALTARFTAPLQVVATPAVKERCTELSNIEQVSLAEIYRRAIDRGLPAVEREIRDAHRVQ